MNYRYNKIWKKSKMNHNLLSILSIQSNITLFLAFFGQTWPNLILEGFLTCFETRILQEALIPCSSSLRLFKLLRLCRCMICVQQRWGDRVSRKRLKPVLIFKIATSFPALFRHSHCNQGEAVTALQGFQQLIIFRSSLKHSSFHFISFSLAL